MADSFVWYELMTPDRTAAADFYAQVVGWTAEDAPGMPYTLLKAGDHQIAGIMETPEHAEGMPPQWFGYIGAEDVDTKVKAVEAAGAALQLGPQDIPGVGRFAVIADPQGAKFMLFCGDGAAMEPLPYMTPGTVGWNELHTQDWEKAWAFYSGQFGWEQGAQLDMGPMGTYQMYKIGRDFDEGAMLNDPQWPGSAWLFYFAVKGVTEARERLIAAGGTAIMGPHEVPGGMWIVLAKDPQGATFAVVGAEKEA
ncbi:hypothetical protein FHS31_001113 [Sphingomonas vulcanisoli]|uniref:VOC domain-containing protein n=1 Tax=Sphingomonas vulcanisoli TaxID=1658060 RepID=A0ABX0TPT4_9SPHN|nr:VOC family protein [Sphingomonas vulcanisoli]NIJ07517.1 hypothetical protein [Sphingomonas vulcanisoli]